MGFHSVTALVARENNSESAFNMCLNNPDLPACENVQSFYEYRISLPANATFLAIFTLSFVIFVATYAVTRRSLAFTVSLLLGVLCEILGYAGRVMSYKNQWSEDGFLIQICCLTIGPAFMAAGIYMCLRRIVYAFGPENSRIAPEWYTRFFIPCDVVSLVLQAAGGGLASVASENHMSVDLGDNIMIAGLSFQVATLLIFMAVSIDFSINVLRRRRQLGEGALDQSQEMRRVRNSWLFKGFIAALILATVCIFWRSVYRVAELSKGWHGPLMKRQDLFIGFEGVMVAVACLALNVFHPSYCIKPLLEGAGGLGSKKKAANARPMSEEDAYGKSEPVSDGTATPY